MESEAARASSRKRSSENGPFTSSSEELGCNSPKGVVLDFREPASSWQFWAFTLCLEFFLFDFLFWRIKRLFKMFGDAFSLESFSEGNEVSE